LYIFKEWCKNEIVETLNENIVRIILQHKQILIKVNIYNTSTTRFENYTLQSIILLRFINVIIII
jgi:hypothetical protein